MTKTILKLFVISLSLLAIACSGGKTPDRRDFEDKRKDRLGRIGGGEGILFGGDSVGQGDTLNGVSVNGFLWRASLDTISFMPLSQVDPFGGVIITDWYSPEQQVNERFKLTVYILAQTLRSDGLRVAAFKEVKNRSGQWQTQAISKDFALKIEESILTKARELRVKSLENQQ